jgi:hypothetical protein
VRRFLSATVVATAVAGLFVAIADPADASGSVGLAPGVVLGHRTFRFHGPQSVWTLSVNLGPHTRLVSTTPQRKIGAPRVNLLTLARQEQAIAGINGDTLYFTDPTNQPRSGVAYNGHTLKSPLQGQQAVLYTTTANRANIGNVAFSGRYWWSTTSAYGKSYPHVGNINTYNSLENAKNGGMTFTDSNLLTRPSMRTIGNAAAQRVSPSCSRVDLQPLGVSRTATGTTGHYRVAGYHTKLSRYTRVTNGRNALFTCGAADKQYLATRIHVGMTFNLSVGYKVAHIVSMISGIQRLIAGGKAYKDKTGLYDQGQKQLADTFACVMKGGTQVLLGTVEGRKKGATGMTYPQLTAYLLGRHCYTAMALSGSTDSQLVAKRPRSTLTFQNRLTYHSGNKPNGLVDGLLVVTS